MKRIAPLLIALVVIVGGVLFLRLVAYRKAPEDLLGSGIIEAKELQRSAKVGGRLAEVLVREGDKVVAGQLIARLEHEDIDAEQQRAQALVDTAEATLRDLERGSRPEQIAAARARVAEAKASRQGAEKQLALAIEANEKVTELRQKLDEAQARVRLAEAGVAQAKATLDEARRGATKEEIETLRTLLTQAESRVEGARLALANAEEIYRHQITIEGPLIAATTEEAVLEATTGLARRELERANVLAQADAATSQTLEHAQTERMVADAKLAGAIRAVGDAQQQVALTRAQAKQMRDAAQTALDEALRARDAAKAKLDVVLAGTREERLRLAEAAVRAAEAEADVAADSLKNATTAYHDRLATREQRETAVMNLERAKALEHAARAELALLLAGNTEEAIKAARGCLAEARATLQAVKVRRSYCDIVAPCAGTVTEVVLEPGEMAAPGSAIVVIADLENLWLRAYLSFATFGAVVKGQHLSVTTEAVPDKIFEGVVLRISDEAEFTPKDVQTPQQRVKQVYWVKVFLGDGEGLLKPGMPADLRRLSSR
ncbi:MAG: efflux RND transporter periplasmic adaptor subunit [Candidatus Zipacnadales bacterium]